LQKKKKKIITTLLSCFSSKVKIKLTIIYLTSNAITEKEDIFSNYMRCFKKYNELAGDGLSRLKINNDSINHSAHIFLLFLILFHLLNSKCGIS
jgi:hypothetical protein